MKRNMKLLSRRLLVLVVFMGLTLSGCGGGGGGGGGGIVDPAAANTINDGYGNPVVNNGVLYLPDWGNSRVLGFNNIPTSDGARANFVLGQPDFATITTGVSQTYLGGPQALSVDNGKFFVTDTDNSRILIYNAAPTSGPGSADVVVGQADFVSNGIATTASGLSSPETSYAALDKLVVADSDNNRVLIWSHIPNSNGVAADIVLGQNSFTNSAANDVDQNGVEDNPSIPSARTLNYPTGVWTDGTKLVVLDSMNNRILIWTSFPTVDFAPANLVLGQADFVSNAFNDDNQDGTSDPHPSNRTLDYPFDGVFCKNGQLFVADNSNDRVLIWNTFPATSFVRADVVLGQVDFSGDTGNDTNGDYVPDTPSAQTLNDPRGVFVEGSELFVSDGLNNRYLIYQARGTVGGYLTFDIFQAASVVIGQSDFVSVLANQGR